MISFKQFLLESHSKIEKIEVSKDFIKTLKDECSFYFNQNPRLPLLRGSKSFIDIAYYPQPENRRPLTSSRHQNDFYNFGFESAFGIKKLRDTSFFCVYNDNIARAYGDPYLVIPKGKFKYCISTQEAKYDDLFGTFHNVFNNIVEGIKYYYGQITKSQEHLFEGTVFDNILLSHNIKNLSDELIKECLLVYSIEDDMSDVDSIDIPRLHKAILSAIKEDFKVSFEITSDVNLNAEKLTTFERVFFEGDGYYMIHDSALADLLKLYKMPIKSRNENFETLKQLVKDSK